MQHPTCTMKESLYAACDAIFSLFAADMAVASTCPFRKWTEEIDDYSVDILYARRETKGESIAGGSTAFWRRGKDKEPTNTWLGNYRKMERGSNNTSGWLESSLRKCCSLAVTVRANFQETLTADVIFWIFPSKFAFACRNVRNMCDSLFFTT